MTGLPPISPLSPLGLVLADIDRALDAKLYYPALLVALTVPEICSALALPKEQFVKKPHYIAFVDKYTTPGELGSDGADIYRLRGGVVHRASPIGHPDFNATHVIFTLPETPGHLHAFSLVDEPTGKRAAMLDLVKFCHAMISAANKWYADNGSKSLVEENMKNLIRYCPFGVAPFVTGAPIVASGQ